MYCFTLFSRKLTILMNFQKYISKAEVRRRFFLYFILSTQYNFINLFSDSMKGWDLILNSENTFKTSGQVRSLGGNNVWAMCKNSMLKRIGCVINWKKSWYCWCSQILYNTVYTVCTVCMYCTSMHCTRNLFFCFTFFYCDGRNFILGLFMDIYEFIWEQNVLILPGKHHVQIVLKYCVLHTVPKIAESPF